MTFVTVNCKSVTDYSLFMQTIQTYVSVATH